METIGRFRIEAKIGEGAMADVFRAFDPNIDRLLAVKVLKKDWLVDEEYRSRFLREARAAGAMSHPNIVTVFDVGTVEDRPFIAMELVEGDTLESYMDGSRRLPTETILKIAIQLANALCYAHRRGVVHRDIKPGNIMLGPDGESVKVADFGIARMEDTEATQIGTMLGTPRYMSPEQVDGKEITGQSDLFSVGVILYELFTGSRAFTAKTVASLLVEITRSKPQPIGKLAPDLPKGIQRIVEKLLSKSPSGRFATGTHLADALTQELEAYREQKEQAQRDRFIPLKVKWTLMMSGIVVVVMAITGSIIFARQYKAMEARAIDSGALLTEFVAAESTLDVLRDEWARIDVFIQDAAARNTFDYIVFLDRNSNVRAASDPGLVGSPYSPPTVIRELADRGTVKSLLVRNQSGRKLDFEAPFSINNVRLGSVHLGLSSKPLDEVAGLTRWLMVLLGVITVAAVAGVSYLFGRLLSRPMRTLSTAMASVGDGDLDYRIAHGRSDEFGQLFDRFNAMATKLGKPAAAPFQDGFDDLIGEVDPSFGERDTDSSALENIVEDGSSPPDETMEQLTEPEPDAGQDPPKKLPPADEVDSEGLEAEPAAQENLDATIVAVRQPPVTSDSAAPTQEPSGASLEDEKPHPDEITEPNTAPVAEHSHNPVETDGVAEGDEIAGDDRTMIVSPRRIKFSPKTKGAPKNNEGEPTDPKESTA